MARLTPETAHQVALLLQGDLDSQGKPSGRKTLGEVASWADEIKHKPVGAGTAPWHFDDIPVCGTATEDVICNGGNCAFSKLSNAIEVLGNAQAAKRDRNEALKWIVHLVGDIHQPLHEADNHDRGGNGITVTFFGTTNGPFGPLNLHGIWDDDMVDRLIQEKGGVATIVQEEGLPQDRSDWETGSVSDWSAESHQLAVSVAYAKLPGGFTCGSPITDVLTIGQDYYSEAAPQIDTQLRKAGVRLAKILNDALGSSAPNSFAATLTRSTAAAAGDAPSSVAAYRRPDPHKTPGRAKLKTAAAVCKMGSTKDARHVTEKLKTDVYESYGIAKCTRYCSGLQGCEIDHLISLELGGDNTADNLWPQPYDGTWNAHDKDRLEQRLHAMICKQKSISLSDAQQEISTDWVAAYKKYIGPLKPFKPVPHCQ